MEKYTINCKNQIIRFYGYDYNSKCYYAIVGYNTIIAKKFNELCKKIYISPTALRRDVYRNDITKF